MSYTYKFFCAVIFTVVFCSEATNNPSVRNPIAVSKGLIDESGATLQTRFNTPEGFIRKPAEENSFANYLRNLPLKPAGTKVKYYNGETKDNIVYDAVVDMPISNKDLQQCADAVMRLRGEYFFTQNLYDQISFTLTNGFVMNYSEWIKGNRLAINGNNTWWKKTAAPSNTYSDFRSFMEIVFTYAGSLSLSKSLQSKHLTDISAGDVFIVGGSPGHAVIVVDVAENKSGEKVFMIAQSYMPAQETQVLKNLNDENISPWYNANIPGDIVTPQWTFTNEQLKAWE